MVKLSKCETWHECRKVDEGVKWCEMKFETQSRPERREGPHHSEMIEINLLAFFGTQGYI